MLPKRTCETVVDAGKSCDQCSLKTEWMTTEQVAQYLILSVASVRNMASNGQLPYRKLGRRNRYLRSEIQNLLLRNERGVNHGN